MVLKMFSIRDAKAEAFLQPFYMTNSGQAIRAVSDIVTDPKHQFTRYPDDFVLYELGTWDDSDGKVKLPATPIMLQPIRELLPQNQQIPQSDHVRHLGGH